MDTLTSLLRKNKSLILAGKLFDSENRLDVKQSIKMYIDDIENKLNHPKTREFFEYIFYNSLRE